MFGFSSKKICSNCGTTDYPDKHTPGNVLIEIILWLFFIIPGLIYTIWRKSNMSDICPSCKSPNPVDLKSPRGIKLLQEFKPS